MTALEPVKTVALVNVETGEALEPSVQNAVTVLNAARRMKDRLQAVIFDATEWLQGESARLGTKTLRDGDAQVTLTGGLSSEIDVEVLRAGLQAAGCPEERIDAAIRATVTFKVDRAVVRQLSAANPLYAKAIAKATRPVELPYRASVKR